MSRLTLADIADLRAYERERDGFRAEIIALKKRRRVGVGPVVTFLFENRDNVRFPIQEMARAERMLTDEAIAHEVDTYNELIPDDGELSATMFVELTDDAKLREWLPKLIGIQRAVRFELGAEGHPVPAVPEDEERLTRDDITTTVHYLKFRFDPRERATLAFGPARLVVDHPEYRASVELSEAQRAELVRDFSE